MKRSAMPFAAELEVALAAAREAAVLLTARSGADEVREKGRADLVTEVDEAAERAITTHIRRHFPDDTLIGEEFSGTTEVAGRSWIIDPVDGTANYVHGHPFACVSIAFFDEEGPAAGVIHAPFLGEVYHAARGGGVWLNDEPVKVSAVNRGSGALFATGFPFKAGKGDPETYFRLVAEVMLGAHDIRRAGSAALDLAFVACGRHDGYFEIGVAPWDIAAGILMVTEGGGRVTGWPGDVRDPIQTGRILATNGLVHEWLEAKVANYELYEL
ncbi:MAG: inositol monophosphatase [Gemmatimonadetes bacterium]|nr:inositol monophosphatase [Gemmatimonadota bacterium]